MQWQIRDISHGISSWRELETSLNNSLQQFLLDMKWSLQVRTLILPRKVGHLFWVWINRFEFQATTIPGTNSCRDLGKFLVNSWIMLPITLYKILVSSYGISC